VIVRGIALGELTWSNSRKALVKEALVGVGNGVGWRRRGGARAWALQGSAALGGVLALAMIINMFVAATAERSSPWPCAP